MTEPAPKAPPAAVRADAGFSIHLGRPLAKDRARTLTAVRPWDAEGMSRSTWYRRRAEKEK